MVLNRLQIPLPPDIQGDIPPAIRHPIFAETYPLPAVSSHGDWRALYTGEFKFLWNSKGDNMLFKLDEDPNETVNLLEKFPDRALAMEETINEFIALLPKPALSTPLQTIDSDTQKALESLGYIQ